MFRRLKLLLLVGWCVFVSSSPLASSSSTTAASPQHHHHPRFAAARTTAVRQWFVQFFQRRNQKRKSPVLSVLSPEKEEGETEVSPSSSLDYRTSPFAVVSTALSTIDTRQLARLVGSSLQFGLICYLGRALWKALAEVLQDLEDTSFCKADMLERTIQAMEESKSSVPTETSLTPLVRQLVKSGLPLRGPVSVESILPTLNKNEAAVLQQSLYVPKEDQHVVVGLTPTLNRLVATVKAQEKENPFSSLFGANTGVLLYGPPGCGKSLLVKALAAYARIPCLVITPSVLLRKFVGETNSQVRSLFTLAQKLAPCIVCVDELDGIFRERNDHEHEVSRDLKTEFLQWWDGLLSDKDNHIYIIGATNRPFDVDNAVLRRLPQSHFIGLPDSEYRQHLLRHFLKSVPHKVDHETIASNTEGYSPSDLKQLLQTAVWLGPMQERRPLATQDVMDAISQCPPTHLSQSYVSALTSFGGRQHQHAQQQAARSGQVGCWETDLGNFYHLGTLQIDPPTFDVLSDLVQQLEDMSENEDEDTNDEE